MYWVAQGKKYIHNRGIKCRQNSDLSYHLKYELSIFKDVFIELEDARCTYDFSEKLAEPGSTLIEAKYLCSIDPTCAKFFMAIQHYDFGTYYKCPVEAENDQSWSNYIMYIKGKNFNLYMLAI